MLAKATGIIRRIDRLSGIVLPVELRLQLGIDEGMLMEVYRNNHFIVLAKHGKGCVFCGATDELTERRGQFVCRSCAEETARRWRQG